MWFFFLKYQKEGTEEWLLLSLQGGAQLSKKGKYKTLVLIIS